MKIEKNKFYETRGSNKAKVYEIYGDKIHGAVSACRQFRGEQANRNGEDKRKDNGRKLRAQRAKEDDQTGYQKRK